MASSNDQCLYISIYVVCCVAALWDEHVWQLGPSCGGHVACSNINTRLRATFLETHRDLCWQLPTWLNVNATVVHCNQHKTEVTARGGTVG